MTSQPPFHIWQNLSRIFLRSRSLLLRLNQGTQNEQRLSLKLRSEPRIISERFLRGEQKVRGSSPFWRFFEIGFLLLIFYLPFQIALNLGPDIDLASGRILILGFSLIWLLASLIFKKTLFMATFLGFGLLAFLVINGLSLFGAQEFGWGLRKLLFFLSIFPLYFIAVGFAKELKGFQKIIKTLIVVAVIVALVGLIQFLSQFLLGFSALEQLYSKKIGSLFWGQSFSSMVFANPSWFVNIGGRTLMRTFGLFPDPHMMAFFLGLILPIVFSLFLFAKKQKIKLFLVSGFLFLVLLLTFSRGGYVGIVASIALMLSLSWRFLGERKKLLILVSFGLSILVLVIFAQPILGRFFSSFSLSEGSSVGRLKIWQDSWQVFLSHPLLGVGLGNYPRVIEPLAQYRTPITSHNLYLDILSETGLFGLATWLFLIFGSVWQLLKAIKKSRLAEAEKDKFLPALKIGLAGSLIYFVVHSFFETAIFNPVILAFLMIILGLISALICHGHHS